MNKRSLLSVHRWLAIPLTLLVLVQALTGIALVYRDEVEGLIHPELTVAAGARRASVEDLLLSVRRNWPDAALKRVEFDERANRAVEFRLVAEDGPIIAALDPFTARVVRAGGVADWPMEWTFLLHNALLAGETGHVVIGLEGIALGLIAIIGLVVWWPGRARLRSGLRLVLDRTSDLRWRTLHRAVGAVFAAFILLSAATGALMVFKGGIRDALHGVVPVTDKPSPTIEEQAGASFLPLDTIIAAAARSRPVGPLRQLRFSSGDRVVAVFFDSVDSARPVGYAQLYYDRYSGRELDSYITGRLPASSEFIDWLYPVHLGLWGGAITRFLLLLTGIVCAGLGITGVWLWWTRRRRSTRRPR